MYGYEYDNFKSLDKKEYILKDNQRFMEYYNNKINLGYIPIINLQEMQQLIEEIALFMEFKYPHYMLKSIIYSKNISDDILNSRKISKLFDIEELKRRLHNDYVQFLDCNYCEHVKLQITNENLSRIWQPTMEIFRISPNGKIEQYVLENLRELDFIQDIDGIQRIEDLLGRFKGIETNVDYSDLERVVEKHKNDISMRNKILNLVSLKIFYDSFPEFSYIRTKSFIRMFNKEYNIKLDINKIEELFEIDYKDTKQIEKIKQLQKI